MERAANGGSGARRLRYLCHLGGFAECALLCAALPVPVLLALHRGELCACNSSAGRIVVESVAGIFDFVDSGRISRHLLLLSQSLLQVVFFIAAGMRSEGRFEILQRRNSFPISATKSSPVFLLFVDCHLDISLVGHGFGISVPGWFRYGFGDHRHSYQCGSFDIVQPFVQLMPACLRGLRKFIS